MGVISIHALREEGDQRGRGLRPGRKHFYPRPPRGGRLLHFLCLVQVFHISIHALREEGDPPFVFSDGRRVPISIHALREEGDDSEIQRTLAVDNISIHALREEGDRFKRRQDVKLTLFLSTPSARRATYRAELAFGFPSNFYPRPPRGGRPLIHSELSEALEISIHALREEGDRALLCVPDVDIAISIHALREEGDGPGRR